MPQVGLGRKGGRQGKEIEKGSKRERELGKGRKRGKSQEILVCQRCSDIRMHCVDDAEDKIQRSEGSLRSHVNMVAPFTVFRGHPDPFCPSLMCFLPPDALLACNALRGQSSPSSTLLLPLVSMLMMGAHIPSLHVGGTVTVDAEGGGTSRIGVLLRLNRPNHQLGSHQLAASANQALVLFQGESVPAEVDLNDYRLTPADKTQPLHLSSTEAAAVLPVLLDLIGQGEWTNEGGELSSSVFCFVYGVIWR